MIRTSIASIALSTLILTSCSSTQPTHIIGAWDLDVEGSSLATAGNMPSSADMNFNPDGTIDIKAILPGLTESLNGTYGFDGDSLTVTHDTNGETETQAMQCHLKGDTLTFANQHGVFLFRKDIPPPPEEAPAE